MGSKLRVNEIINYFDDKSFTSEDLYNFYANFEPNLKQTTFRGRIHTLKNDGVIQTLKKGVYTTINKREFEPVIDLKLIQLFSIVRKQFPYTDICIWETSWLNNYMIHQPFSNNIVLEVEKDAASTVFAYLQESTDNIYLNPGKFEVDTYMKSGQINVIVKNLTLTSPLSKREDIVIPTIEKIMVDLFIENKLYIAYQGAELKNIYHELFKTYKINQSTLRQYANKRHVKEKLILFLEHEVEIDKSILLMRGA